MSDGSASGTRPRIAVDRVGAGPGDRVLVIDGYAIAREVGSVGESGGEAVRAGRNTGAIRGC